MSAIQSAVQTIPWEIDAAHSHVEFAVKHLMIATVKGRFSDVQGTITLNEASPRESTVHVTINPASIDTRQEQRDAHLRSPDFLDVEQYPTITFQSKRVEGDITGDFQLVGDLTIRNTTREVTLEVSNQGRARDPWGNEKAGFSATTKINRTQFGLTWNQALETGGVLVGEEIKITIEIEAQHARAA